MSRIALILLFRRTLLAIPILLCVSALVFIVLRLLPADPIAMSLPPGASAEDMAKLRQSFGLDRPLPEQYVIWLGKLVSGDLGTSIYFRRGVAELVSKALPATLELVAAGLIVGIVAGVAGGLAMFAWRGKAGEQVLDLGTSGLMAIPEFLWAILLILLFGVALARHALHRPAEPRSRASGLAHRLSHRGQPCHRPLRHPRQRAAAPAAAGAGARHRHRAAGDARAALVAARRDPGGLHHPGAAARPDRAHASCCATRSRTRRCRRSASSACSSASCSAARCWSR